MLMYEDTTARNQWPLGVVVEVETHNDGLVRAVKVKSAKGTVYRRPIQKVVLLVEASGFGGGM